MRRLANCTEFWDSDLKSNLSGAPRAAFSKARNDNTLKESLSLYDKRSDDIKKKDCANIENASISHGSRQGLA